MTMIEIPLKSAVISGDRGTIELPLGDVLEAVKNPRCRVRGEGNAEEAGNRD